MAISASTASDSNFSFCNGMEQKLDLWKLVPKNQQRGRGKGRRRGREKKKEEKKEKEIERCGFILTFITVCPETLLIISFLKQ